MDKVTQPPALLPQATTVPIAVRVKEACRLTGIGRSKLYLLMKEGHIATVKVGSMTLIPMGSLENLLRPAER